MTSRLLSMFAAAGVGLAFVVPAVAAETISQEVPDAAACTKTVNAMGASMGHQAETAPDGSPVYRFVLRTNGFDYDVVCDAKTGVVSDVSPRTTH
jgi:hypothetical protein